MLYLIDDPLYEDPDSRYGVIDIKNHKCKFGSNIPITVENFISDPNTDTGAIVSARSIEAYIERLIAQTDGPSKPVVLIQALSLEDLENTHPELFI